MQIAPEVEEAFDMSGQERLTLELVEEIAADVGASEAQVVVSAAMMTDIQFDESAPIRFEVCVGGCQSWGAIPVFKELVKLRAAKNEAFGVVPKRCLDKCDRAAVVLIKTPDGTAGISEATPESVAEAVSQALG